MREAWGTAGYMMSHDEIRTLNQDEACRRRNLTAGQILADNVRACRALLKPAKAYVWNDMFDPYHNAKDNYYLVRGTLAGSWEGVPKDALIMNWNSGKPKESLAFFAGRGHRQILAGYYDSAPDSIKGWLATAKSLGDARVVGAMYTTWRADYSNLEAFAKAAWD